MRHRRSRGRRAKASTRYRHVAAPSSVARAHTQHNHRHPPARREPVQLEVRAVRERRQRPPRFVRVVRGDRLRRAATGTRGREVGCRGNARNRRITTRTYNAYTAQPRVIEAEAKCATRNTSQYFQSHAHHHRVVGWATNSLRSLQCPPRSTSHIRLYFVSQWAIKSVICSPAIRCPRRSIVEMCRFIERFREL